ARFLRQGSQRLPARGFRRSLPPFGCCRGAGMKQDPDSGEIAYRVADRLKTDAPWEVYAERSERYEVHFNGTATELIHGPIALAGFGVRISRPRNGKTSTGFQASTDLSDAGIRAALEDAE